MLYREIIAVCSEIHTKHINTLCGQNVELLNVKLAVHIVTTALYRVNFILFARFVVFTALSLNILTFWTWRRFSAALQLAGYNCFVVRAKPSGRNSCCFGLLDLQDEGSELPRKVGKTGPIIRSHV